MDSLTIRKKFFDYFKKLQHEEVASSSLIPAQDPTLLFTNAGMNQFKDVLLGKEQRSYKRAVSIQKCVRAGGKHNDLDNVGFTQRHLTFFEMMGNFSFGDYFKKEAIPFAWNFLTQEMRISSDKLYVSVHETDDEAFDIWKHDIGLTEERIFRLGEDNFWQMGDVGPCGPCTEIFVDRGEGVGCGQKDCDLACDCDRFLEVWNVVFMQYDRQANGKDAPLDQTGIDTGMGLERLCLIMQNKESVFDIDLFKGCIKKTEELTGYKYHEVLGDKKAAFNVLADHIRSSTFLISDGCAPSNEGRGYVLRKIIRRAALFAQKLTDKNIFPQLATVLIEDMQGVYPDLAINKERIVSVLKVEIEKFSDSLIRGKQILEGYMDEAGDSSTITGEQAFKLYDTYGFPLEVVQLIATDRNFKVDVQGFEEHMEEQRQRSGKKMKQGEKTVQINESVTTEFTGYESLHEQATIQALVQNNSLVDHVAVGQTFAFIPDKTPFYVECGGQVDDRGVISFGEHTAELLGLQKLDNAILITCKAPTNVSIGDVISMQVDKQFRLHTMKNHTATHLLQAALQQTLGKQVKQAGSVVTKEHLRFDYTYHQPLSDEQIKCIEDIVNEKIWENIPVAIEWTTLKEATKRGIIAFFGDKYNPDAVRAVLIPGFSSELCGGTHVSATGDIGAFKIVEETALAAGQRRIVAYTGGKALEEFQQDFSLVKDLTQTLKVKPAEIVLAVDKLHDKIKELQKEVKIFKKDQWRSQLATWIEEIEDVAGIAYNYIQVSGYAHDDLRAIITSLQAKKPGFYFIINIDEDKAMFLGSVAQQLASRVSMKQFKQWLQEACGLKGGGNDTVVQGGGKAPDPTCKEQMKAWLALQ